MVHGANDGRAVNSIVVDKCCLNSLRENNKKEKKNH